MDVYFILMANGPSLLSAGGIFGLEEGSGILTIVLLLGFVLLLLAAATLRKRMEGQLVEVDNYESLA
jgi:hypothetical protein